jgi:hypothetical protein
MHVATTTYLSGGASCNMKAFNGSSTAPLRAPYRRLEPLPGTQGRGGVGAWYAYSIEHMQDVP